MESFVQIQATCEYQEKPFYRIMICSNRCFSQQQYKIIEYRLVFKSTISKESCLYPNLFVFTIL